MNICPKLQEYLLNKQRPAFWRVNRVKNPGYAGAVVTYVYIKGSETCFVSYSEDGIRLILSKHPRLKEAQILWEMRS